MVNEMPLPQNNWPMNIFFSNAASYLVIRSIFDHNLRSTENTL